MAKYKLTENGVQDTETGAFIPNTNKNRDWRKYQNWLKGLGPDGPFGQPGEPLGTGPNTPDPQYTPEEIEAKKQFEKSQAANAVVEARLKLDAAKAEGLEIEADCLAELETAREKLTALNVAEIREPTSI
jgi:hypothetical protein